MTFDLKSCKLFSEVDVFMREVQFARGTLPSTSIFISFLILLTCSKFVLQIGTFDIVRGLWYVVLIGMCEITNLLPCFFMQ